MSGAPPATRQHGAPATAPLAVPDAPPAWVPGREQLAISATSYRWTARVFAMLERVLKVNMKLYAPEHLHDGEIFLFNHVARFETFIPQYFIWSMPMPTKSCRCTAFVPPSSAS